jgi:predicted dehydrogenase
MTNNILNVGVVGCGHLGSIHCKLLKQISEKDKRINFSGIFDINEDVAAKVSSENKIKKFSSFDSLLGEINTLIIVTPTTTHFDLAESALKNSVNIFIEKPVTQNLGEAISLVKTAQGSEGKIQIGHVERFNPALISLQNYELKPKFIEVHRLAQFNPRGTDVSVIHDLMIHDIDIILSLVKSPIEKIDANGVAVISDTVDIANARITFKNGCVANLTSSRISLKKMRKMRIFQSNAYVSLDFLNNKTEVFILGDSDTKEGGMRVIPLSGDKKIIYDEPKMPNAEFEYNPIKVELASFFESILENKPVRVSLEEGKQALEVSERIFKIISDMAGK